LLSDSRIEKEVTYSLWFKKKSHHQAPTTSNI